jgi:hypothetical protein
MLHGVMSLAKLEIQSSVILLHTAIRDPAFPFLLVRFFPPCFLPVRHVVRNEMRQFAIP